jgi:hypothetical protein
MTTPDPAYVEREELGFVVPTNESTAGELCCGLHSNHRMDD